MDPISPTNSVERRMLKINDDWQYFTQKTTAKWLYWQLPEADHPLLHTFFQVQGEYANGVQLFQTEFMSGKQYVTDIIRQLDTFYASRKAGALAQGIPAYWELPERGFTETDISYLFRVLSDLSDYHPTLFPFFTLILVPYKVSSNVLLSEWFIELLSAIQTDEWIAEHLRIVSFSPESDWLLPLIDQFPEDLCLLQRHYHADNIPRELLSESSDRGAGADFRRIFVELFSVIEEKNPQKLTSLVDKAIPLCQSQRWFDQMVVTQLIAGAAYLSWNEDQNALQAYQHAVSAAKQAVEDKHPAGEKLVANAYFGVASVYLKNKQYQDAARCYQLIPPYTSAVEDHILTVEAWRMEAFCWQQAKEYEPAIQAGLQALESGLPLDDTLRLNSSLPIAANALIDIIAGGHRYFDDVTELLEQLYGDEWRDVLHDLQHTDNQTV